MLRKVICIFHAIEVHVSCQQDDVWQSCFSLMMLGQERCMSFSRYRKVLLHCLLCRYSHKLMELVRQVLDRIGSFEVQPERFQVTPCSCK